MRVIQKYLPSRYFNEREYYLIYLAKKVELSGDVDSRSMLLVE
jgi:hypothetical protein